MSLAPEPAADPRPHERAGEVVTGAQAVMRSLEALGVDVVFGYPGGAILPAYDPLIEADFTHVLVRHEQGAIHMAEGYAHATGRVGVCIVTSGPAATNLVTGLADAHMDSVPILAITGQVATTAIGSDAFQEADVTGITMPITKHNEIVYSAERIAGAIAEAFYIARSGRPGPVLVDLPKDVLNAKVAWQWPEHLDLPGYRPTVRGHGKMIREALDLIAGAERPVIYAGGGLVRAGADEELRAFAETLGLPVVTTLMARGILPDTHELTVGMPGMHGHYAAVKAFQETDLLITLGARFDDRVTGHLASFAPHAKVIHVDVDPAEIGKNREVDVPIVGDVKVVLGQLLKVIEDKRTKGTLAELIPDVTAWRGHLDQMKADHPLRVEQPETGVLKPQTAIRAIHETWGDDAVYVAGVGQHQMWAAQHIPYTRGRQWINSGGLGTMGFAVPAAIGAKVGVGRDVPVVAIDGDGCFQMTFQELAAAVQHDIPVVFCVINNGYLGMVRQWQHLFYEDRLSQVALPQDLPDLMKLADAYQMPGFRISSVDELDATLAKAKQITDQPILVEFRVDPDEMVFPMVPSGASNDEILESAEEWHTRAAAAAEVDDTAPQDLGVGPEII
ncbi:biosynthetic-type acetolactate synthase large subunit [Nitriliruptor alkaliphilus]|uniref:biosynthetic-type acetolactate synthase large subunit n=1 Tax=Nitriliruptor alkaliphilus TaxID=427918 RepID=UPI0009F9721E|nr:biosynthetic-type acetolactate synthase large subunit [Nitriliruptor alkaliphilus]